MAGGLSAGSVHATRRPRHVLPGGGTALRSGALPPRLRLRGRRRRFDQETPAPQQGRTSPAGKVKTRAQLPRSTSGAKMASAYGPQRNAVRRRRHPSVGQSDMLW